MPDRLLDRVVAAVGDRYAVEAELGRGGTGVVYRARDVRLRRLVALKVLPPDLAFRAGIRERFLQEAQTSAKLSHPNIVPIFSVDEVDGLVYFAMALVDGETLGQRLAREPKLPVQVARRILTEVAEALAYAHRHGVVHRDVKPDNVLIDRESGRSMVSDFGIARAVEADQRLTVTGVAVGTPAYMSPEQAMGDRELDGRSDIYSLGVVGYQMLAGELPFHAATAAAMLMKHVGERPRPILERRPDAPPALAAAVETALAKKPEDRWPDAAAFRAALMDASFAAPLAPGAMVAVPVPNGVPPARGDARRAGGPDANAEGARDEASGAPLSWRDARRQWDERRNAERERWRDEQQRLRDQPRNQPRDQQRDRRDEQLDELSAWRDGPRAALARIEERAAARAAERTALRGAAAEQDERWAQSVLERRAESFRRKVFSTFAVLFALAVVNGVTSPQFPWVVFPAFGMLGGLFARWGPLREAGLRFRDVMAGGGAAVVRHRDARPGATPLLVAAGRFRRRAFGAGAALLAAILFATIGSLTGADPFLVFFAIAGVAFVLSLAGALRYGFQVRAAGMTLGDTLSSRWREVVAALDPRPREQRVREAAATLVDGETLAGRHGATVLAAVDDGLTVRETLVKLSPADRALIPDVQPTVTSLVARVAAVAQSLHRLDKDVRPGQLEELDARLVFVRAEPVTSPDRERKLQLLERQRASVSDLLERRASLLAQLESAQLVLQTIKLDLVKLRSAGIGAATGDVSGATQEARALSRDIKYAIEAAAEVRSA